MEPNSKCYKCNLLFNCNLNTFESCWCNNFSPFISPENQNSCLCPQCLKEEYKLKIDKFVNSDMPIKLKIETINNLPTAKTIIEEIDYYIDNGKWVFTEWYHLKRGYCCKNDCRHCPYK